jgi:hypothetical protein
VTPEHVTVFRKFNPAKDDLPSNASFSTPTRDWVIAIHTWPTGWQELAFPSVQEARAYAVRVGAAFDSAMKSSTKRS